MSEQMREDERTEERVNGPAKFDPRVDLSQLRSMLRLTPAERFHYAVAGAINMRKLVEYARAHK
jgi:hypothetical protein